MKNLILSLVIVCCSISMAYSQSYLDSLKQVLKNASNDIVKMEVNSELLTEYIHFNKVEDAKKTKSEILRLIETNTELPNKYFGLSALTEFYLDAGDVDSAALYANQLDKILETENTNFNYNSFKVLAQYYRMKNEFDSAKKTLNEGIEHFSSTHNIENKFKLLGELALVYDIQGDIDSSLYFYRKQEDYFEKNKNYQSLAAVYQNIGVAFYYQGNLEKAVIEFIKAKEFFEKINDSITVFELNSNIGVVFNELAQHKKGLSYLNNAKIFADKYGDDRQKGKVYSFLGSCYESQDSTQQALWCHRTSLKFHEKIDSKRDIAINYHNIATLYDNIDSLDQAINYYLKAVELKKELGLGLSLAYSQQGLGKVFLKQGNLNDSYDFLSKALIVFESQKAEKHIKEVYKAYAELYAQKGDYKNAYNFYEKYIVLKDKIESVEIKERINDLELRYEVAKKDEELLRLQNEQTKSNLKIAQSKIEKNNKNRLILVLSFITLFIIIAAVYYFKRQKEKSEVKKELAVNQAIFESEQKERIRIARDLHDSVGQKLAVTKMLLSDVESNDNVSKTTSFIDEIAQEVRDISHDLIPEILNLGLIKALEDLKDKINLTEKIHLDLKIDKNAYDWSAKKEVEVSIYRIIQEILGNIIKHSKTDKVLMEFKSFDKFIQLKIIDNGIGFNANKMGESKGIGWKNIFARIKLINGDFKVQSEKNKGSQFTLNIPTL